ncbi:MAG: AI-2E family transporter [Leptospiraceae bacterium]|nr:AI-2E family transporter [Leptospiraceae bacterium]MDW8305541.1 AI-2E family transporter [Leptospiraceae bacterium]
MGGFLARQFSYDEAYEFLDISRFLPYAVLALFLLLGFFTFLIYSGYIMAFFLALIFYLLFRKVHRQILKWTGVRRTLAALLSTLIVLIAVMIPSILATLELAEQAYAVYLELRDFVLSSRILEIIGSNEKLSQYIPMGPEQLMRLQEFFAQLTQKLGIETLKRGGDILLAVGRILLNFVFSIFILFFLFRGGDRIGPILYRSLPFPDAMERALGERMLAILDAVLQGSLLISLAHATTITLYFWIFGIKNPLLYGFLAGIFSLVPVIGTAIIWLPAAIYLYVHNETSAAIALGVLSLSTFILLENLVRPLLLDKKLNLHPLFLFLAILGGLQQFGIKGLILGPFLVTLFLSFWEMISFWNENYQRMKKKNANAS